MNLRNTKHKLSRTRICKIWYAMRSRCYKNTNISYNRYGGRGIKICNEWREKVKEFYKWSMNNNYGKNLFIDRINNDGNYSPENCRWATRIVQCRNKSNNRILNAFGESKCLTEWSYDDRCKVSLSGLWNRIRKGVSSELAISDIAGKYKKKLIQNDSIFGRLKVLKENGRLKTKHSSTVLYLCKCNCGNRITVRGTSLRAGSTKSCGCLIKGRPRKSG